jgi:predicted RNase H-like nuclease (RuvC/YqgF family)
MTSLILVSLVLYVKIIYFAEKSVSSPPKKKPELAPKPKVILQKNTEELAAMEQVIQVLKRENIDLKKQVQEQADVIVGLRRDLAGASARLSDMKGQCFTQFIF